LPRRRSPAAFIVRFASLRSACFRFALAAATWACLGTAAAQPAAQSAAVTVASVASAQFFPERDAPAATIARNESRLGAEIAARIAAIAVEVGQTVARGAVVVQLDDADARLAVAQAQAALESAQARRALAESQLERARDLQRQQFISAEALSQRETETAVVRAEVSTAEAALRSAQRTLQKATIRAPFTGVVMARPGQVGEIAQPGAPLVVLKDAAAPEVASPIPAELADHLGPKLAFEFVAPDKRYALRLLRVSPAVQAATRTREARLAFVSDAPPAGTEGRLHWRDPRPHLPAELIVQRSRNGQPAFGVFVVESGRAAFVPIARAQAGRPAVSPLKAGTQVVVNGQAALQDGQAVTVNAR
jgi:RND family efflux transporter MFP subunit